MTILGQHFLINKNKIKKIVDALGLKSGDAVIEIGPGHGELTLELRIRNAELRIIAIEKDKKLADNLKDKFKKDKDIEIIEGDALKILPELTVSRKRQIKNYKIVGNIPYYITGYLLRIIGELKNKPSLIILTIQKEVAERAAAKPPKMNLLAASVQIWAKMEIIGHIPRKDFQPMPEVDSAIIKLTPKTKTLTLTPKPYYSFIKILFKQPRKTILNNLRQIANNAQPLKEKIELIGINPNNRPQNLSIERIIKLAQILK